MALNKLTICFIILTFLIPNLTFSKPISKIYKGYVITNSDERLLGQIEMLSPSLNEIKVKFIGEGEVKRVFKAKEVKEYAFQVKRYNRKEKKHVETWVTYIRKEVTRPPVAFGGTKVLIEREVAGAINMYNYFIEQNSKANSPFLHIIYLEKTENELIEINKENYKKQLKALTKDYTALNEMIGKRGYTFGVLANTLEEYNKWKNNNTVKGTDLSAIE